MRKLAAIGALAAGIIGSVSGASAAQVDSVVGGSLENNTNTCFNIVAFFIASDCSYANTRFPASSTPTWVGPVFATGFYPAPGPALGYIPVPGDGKLSVPLGGTVTIDTQDTASGADDTISAVWTFGEGAHYAATGQGDFARETWDEFTHTMTATPVNFATANGDGGFDYVIGSRGRPTPVPGPLAGVNPNTPPFPANTGVFPSETALNLDVTGTPLAWESTGASDLAAAQRIGIERSAGFGMVDDMQLAPTGTLSPNVGAQTTGAFTNYRCLDNGTDDDCSTSEILFGSANVSLLKEDGTYVTGNGAAGQAGGDCTDGVDNDGNGDADALDPQCAPRTGPPGFENVILILSTDSSNRVKSAEAYWTREYTIKTGPQIGNDLPTGLTRFATPNSWTGGRFTFKGCSFDGPAAIDDLFTVAEGAVDAQLNILTNDTLSCADPNDITVANSGVTAQGGQATVSGGAIQYDAPPNFFSGTDSFSYTVTDLNNATSTATVTVTVTKKVPTASNQSGTSSAGAPVSKTVITSSNQGSGTIEQHTVNVGASTLGTCSASGAILTFTPTAGGNGTGGCSYSITDADGDESNAAQFNVDVQSSGGGGGGSGGPQLPGGGSSLDALTLAALLAGLPLVARRRRKQR